MHLILVNPRGPNPSPDKTLHVEMACIFKWMLLLFCSKGVLIEYSQSAHGRVYNMWTSQKRREDFLLSESSSD